MHSPQMQGHRGTTRRTGTCRRAPRPRYAWGFLLGVFWIATATVPTRVESGGLDAEVASGANLFQEACAVCHGRDATGARGPDLTRGTFRHAADAAALFRVIGKGIPGSSMPGALSIHSERAVWQLVAYVQSLNSLPASTSAEGDAAAGKQLFEQRGRCATCHLVDGHGGCQGPDLSGIGRGQTRSTLRLSLAQPSAEVEPAWWSVRVVDDAGGVHTGRRMDEDTFSVRLLDGRGRLRSFERAAVRSIQRIEASTMPGYEAELTPADVDDLIAYLMTLTRQ
jgi:cytochrome c oxidase cbb3-type subunit III